MKKGYLYLVVSNFDENSNIYQFYDLNILVECTRKAGTKSWRFEDECGMVQYLGEGHVVEIGKI